MPAAGLLGPAEIREIAGRLGVRPSKRLGQNFVTDPGTVRRIVALAQLGPGDAVLEDHAVVEVTQGRVAGAVGADVVALDHVARDGAGVETR